MSICADLLRQKPVSPPPLSRSDVPQRRLLRWPRRSAAGCVELALLDVARAEDVGMGRTAQLIDDYFREEADKRKRS